MKKTFVIQVEYPNCDFVSSEEIAEVAQECIGQYLERYFGANIMDGDYDRIKVKEVTNFFSLVKRMMEAQTENRILEMRVRYYEKTRDSIPDDVLVDHARSLDKVINLEGEVDEYLKKFN